MINNCPTNNNNTKNCTKHFQCLFVVFPFDMAFQQNWNNKPNAEADYDRQNHIIIY